MSRPKASTTRDKQRILCGIVLLLVFGYVYGRPTLERWLGQPLPALGTFSDEQAGERTDPPELSNGESKSSQAEKEFFTDLGRKRLQSPAGLVYGVGPEGENRVDHVLLHAEDDPSRPVHSVFDGTRDEIFETIDQAWLLAKAGGRGVEKSVEDDRTVYTVYMNRTIGYEGGQSGKRKDFPMLNRLRLVIEDNNHLISAYPFR